MKRLEDTVQRLTTSINENASAKGTITLCQTVINATNKLRKVKIHINLCLLDYFLFFIVYSFVHLLVEIYVRPWL